MSRCGASARMRSSHGCGSSPVTARRMAGMRTAYRVRPFLLCALLLEKLEHFLKELKAILLEQDEMRRVGNQHAAFRGCMHEIAHQSFPILRKRPGVIGPRDDQRRSVNARGVPQ